MVSASQKTVKKWRLIAPPPDGFRIDLGGISPVLGHGPLQSRILYNRGVRTQAVARTFLNPDLSSLTDPFALPDMERATDRILRAVKSGEPVGVFGDFDVDGLTGTAIIVRTVEALGGSALPRIPNRETDGHGLSMQAVRAFADAGVKLIVTVDTGSTAVAEVAAAAEAGIDVIITDHHLMDEEAPKAVALVNPQLIGGDAAQLAGAGVAFKLAQALWSATGGDWPYELLALAALGTIADSSPLSGENRVIVRFGLEELGRTQHPGLQALLDIARPGSSYGRPDTELVSFYISPRLNAPGRLGDAEPSLRILTTSDPEEAVVLAGRLDESNKERRRLSEQAWRQAEKQLGDVEPSTSFIAVRCEGVPAGILGPLAGRLADTYRAPAVAYGIYGDVARASARSIPGFDFHAALTPVSEMLIKFGGHAMAAGFTVGAGYVDAVLGEIGRQAEWALMGVDTEPALDIDAELPLEDMGSSMWDFVRSMEPFGAHNAKPVFLSRGVLPGNVRTMGATGRHLRMTVEDGGRRVDAIGFGLGGAPLGRGALDIVYELRSNTWRGRERRELGLLDIRPARD